MRRIGRYLVEKDNEDGSLVARDPMLDRVVSLLVLGAEADDVDRARFRRQARAAAAIDHPHVVRVLETGEDEGVAFIAYQLVVGPTLRDRTMASTKQIDRWLVEIAEALEAMHDAGIVHRAVRAENVHITSTGKAKLGGFALARSKDAAPDSFRTKTVTSVVDETRADRVQWAEMALAFGSPRIAKVAKRAHAAHFDSTHALVLALAALDRRTSTTPIFVGAAIVTLALGGALGAYAWPKRAHPSPPSAPPIVDASIVEIPAEAEAPPAPVVSASAPSPPASTSPNVAPYVNVLVPKSGCFSDDAERRIKSAYRAVARAMAACMRERDEHNEWPSLVRIDFTITPTGDIDYLHAQRALSRHDEACIEAVAHRAWPANAIPKCGEPAAFQVWAYRECYCPPDIQERRPRCEECKTESKNPRLLE